jgi:hypothetical protein
VLRYTTVTRDLVGIQGQDLEEDWMSKNGHGDCQEGHFIGHGNRLYGKEPLNGLLNSQAIQTAIVQTNGHLKENNCPFTWPMSMQMALKWPHCPVHSHGFVQVNSINIS